jgi:PAS domain S-box-containing protein
MRNTEWAIPTTQLTKAFEMTRKAAQNDHPIPQPTDGNAIITIDTEGRITECNHEAEELLGWDADDQRGRAATSVIPTLPFSPKTPGYNLAYAIFHAANGIWMPRVAIAQDGRSVCVDTALSSAVVDSVRHITLSLRPSMC